MAQHSYADVVFARSATDVKNFLAVFFCNQDLFAPDVAAAASQQQPQQKVVASWHLNVLYREYAADLTNPALPDHTANAAKATESLQEMVAWKRRIAVVPPPNGIPPPPPPPGGLAIPTSSTQNATADKVLAKMTGEFVLTVDELRIIVDPNGAESASLKLFSTMTLRQYLALYQSPAGGPTVLPRILAFDTDTLKRLSGDFADIAAVVKFKHYFEGTLRHDFLANCAEVNDPRLEDSTLREIAVHAAHLDLVRANCIRLNMVDVRHGKGVPLTDQDFIKINHLKVGTTKPKKIFNPFGRSEPALQLTSRFWAAVIRRFSGFWPINLDKMIRSIVAPHPNGSVNHTADAVAVRVAECIENTLRVIPFHERRCYDATLQPALSPLAVGTVLYYSLLSEEVHEAVESLKRSTRSTEQLMNSYPHIRELLTAAKQPAQQKPTDYQSSSTPYKPRRQPRGGDVRRGATRQDYRPTRRSYSPDDRRGSRRSPSASRTLSWADQPAARRTWKDDRRDQHDYRDRRLYPSKERTTYYGNAALQEDMYRRPGDRGGGYGKRGRSPYRSESPDRRDAKRVRYQIDKKDLSRLVPSNFNRRELAEAWEEKTGQDPRGKCFMGRLFEGKCRDEQCRSKSSHASAQLLPEAKRLEIFNSLAPRGDSGRQ